MSIVIPEENVHDYRQWGCSLPFDPIAVVACRMGHLAWFGLRNFPCAIFVEQGFPMCHPTYILHVMMNGGLGGPDCFQILVPN